MADNDVNVDMIVQNTSEEGVTDISFTLPTEQMEIGKEIMMSVATDIGAGEVSTDDSIGRVSVVGAGMPVTLPLQQLSLKLFPAKV